MCAERAGHFKGENRRRNSASWSSQGGKNLQASRRSGIVNVTRSFGFANLCLSRGKKLVASLTGDSDSDSKVPTKVRPLSFHRD
jgi:hypothetical protein